MVRDVTDVDLDLARIEEAAQVVDPPCETARSSSTIRCAALGRSGAPSQPGQVRRHGPRSRIRADTETARLR